MWLAMHKDALKEYIIFNKNKLPEELTPKEALEVLLAYVEYQEA